MATVTAYLAGFSEDTIPYLFFGINAVLVAVGTKILGKGFGAKTIYGILLVFGLLYFLPKLPFLHYITDSFTDSDKLICAIIGGFISGFGIAITFMNGGSAGGTDIVAMIITKYRSTTPGKVFLYADLLIVSASFFIDWDFRTIVYGFVVLVIFSYSVDLFLSGSKQSVQMLIFSKHYEALANRISQEANRGVTVVSSMGWYSKEEGKMLVVVARKYEMASISHIIKEVDPRAFITVASVTSVYGQGFDEMKTTKPRKTINIG